MTILSALSPGTLSIDADFPKLGINPISWRGSVKSIPEFGARMRPYRQKCMDDPVLAYNFLLTYLCSHITKEASSKASQYLQMATHHSETPQRILVARVCVPTTPEALLRKKFFNSVISKLHDRVKKCIRMVFHMRLCVWRSTQLLSLIACHLVDRLQNPEAPHFMTKSSNNSCKIDSTLPEFTRPSATEDGA